MRYGYTTEATDFSHKQLNDWRVRLLKAVLFFVPRANPDIEKQYPLVKRWALELSDDGWPEREIGIDEAGKPLFRTPDGRNTGFWPDMASKKFEPSELEPMTENDFQNLWASLHR